MSTYGRQETWALSQSMDGYPRARFYHRMDCKYGHVLTVYICQVHVTRVPWDSGSCNFLITVLGNIDIAEAYRNINDLHLDVAFKDLMTHAG